MINDFLVKISRTDKRVSMQVLSMPEEWRGRGLLYEFDGFILRSVDYCDLYHNCDVYVHGRYRHCDNDIATIYFRTPESAKKYYISLKLFLQKVKTRDK